jgi:hypothetical protein
MCFSKPKEPTVAPIAAAPTAVSTGESESMKETRNKDRQRQRAAAGYQQNILTGSTGVSDSGNVAKKTLLG